MKPRPYATIIFVVCIMTTSLGFAQRNGSKPVITAQTPLPLLTAKGTSITIGLDNLVVSDSDPSTVYPEGFSLEVGRGKDYNVQGATVVPDDDFLGTLFVPVRVDNGKNKSDQFDVQIEVVVEDIAPTITGQSPLSIGQGSSLTVELGHLQVTDPDNAYPTGFTLTVFAGNHYTVTGSTITPDADFSGKLKVPVSVNDGESESNRFDLDVEVIKSQNIAPRITGQSPLSIDQGSSLTVELSHLQVTDPDNAYPTGFTLTVFAGNHYTITGNTITPDADFSGKLKVPVSVNDGESESNRFDLEVEVIKSQNIAPRITGQSPLNIDQGSSLTVELSHLQVTDPDNAYPTGFTLTVFAGNHYTITGNTITPDADFSGKLKVPVSVNDGESESNRFDLEVEVIKSQNIAPRITGQSPLSIDQGSSLTVELSHLQVTDPDNAYPTGFTLTIFARNHYTVTGNTITPDADFSGKLKVPVSVNDGESESNRFDLEVEVIKSQNIAPRITNQSPLNIDQGSSLTVELSHLEVTDPDNAYPTGFTLTVFAGNHYTVTGNTITPDADFSGKLKVPVSVNDGESESNRFDLEVEVIKSQNIAPRITGQSPLNIDQGSSLTVELSHLQVTDPDNAYPTGFTLTVFAGNHYTVTGNTITPDANFSGKLKIPVSVNDGESESSRFDLDVEVIKSQNKVAQITGQVSLSTNEDESFVLHLSDLKVSDLDNEFPRDFTLIISEGLNYTVSGTTITPVGDFMGTLSIPVRVNDGKDDSAPFNVQVIVLPVNDVPLITGQVSLRMDENTSIIILTSFLTVEDPDNDYPDDFTLKILKRENYSVAANVVSPAPDFSGMLEVVIAVNDGQATSAEYRLKINVIPSKENSPPVITGQKEISITQNTTFNIQLSQLFVSDPDDKYPQGFTLKVFEGTDYFLSGSSITPNADIVNGTIVVAVTVNDGEDDSQPYALQIQVTALTARPKINGQKELSMMEDSTIVINLTDLNVTDVDSPGYPNGFTLTVLPSVDNAYITTGNTVKPASNLTGFIEIRVTVSDGVYISDVFRLAVLVMPVNDAPELSGFDTTPLTYLPGNDPVSIAGSIDVNDVDSDHLIFAEIGIRSSNFSPQNDILLFNSTNAKIRGVSDGDGKLFLIGYATNDEYRDVLRSIQYSYRPTQDENGTPVEILFGPRTIYATVFDGQLTSRSYERVINVETSLSLRIPNAFTPNGDSVNDTWKLDVADLSGVDHASIRVYDKRGRLVYESNDFMKEWDGMTNGQILPVDTYYYTIDLNLSSIKKTYKGSVTVLH